MDDVNEAPVEPADQPEVTDAPPVEGTSAEVESFTDIDPTEAPEGDVTPEWLQERYKQMQADYTRKRQAEAETAKQRAEELEFLESLRSDRETQQAVLEQLQELLAEEAEDPEATGEEETELERTVRELREKNEEREAQALAQSIVQHIHKLADTAQLELDDSDLEDVFNRAISGDVTNAEATEKAFKAWHEREQSKQAKWQKAYLASKQASQQVPGGQSATDKPDLSDPDVRRARMAAIIGREG